jgi:hypothetical protein
MKTYLATVAGLLVSFASAATAQAQNPYARPTITPWLNLNRGGQSIPLNYLNLVRPEFNTQAAIGQLQQDTLLNQRAIAAAEAAPDVPVTGHAAGFMTQGRYFQNLGGGGAPGFGSAGGIGTQKPTSGYNQPTSGQNKPTIR